MSNKVEATYHGGPFPGKPHTAPSAKPEPRQFKVLSRSGNDLGTIAAHYVSFQAAHVTFWLDDGTEYDALVCAMPNDEASYIEEIKP